MRILLLTEERVVGAFLAQELENVGHETFDMNVRSELDLVRTTCRESMIEVAVVDIDSRAIEAGVRAALMIARECNGVSLLLLSGEASIPGDLQIAAVGVLNKPLEMEDLLRAVYVAAALAGGRELQLPAVPASLHLFR